MTLEDKLNELIAKGERNSIEYHALVYAIYYTPGTTHKNKETCK